MTTRSTQHRIFAVLGAVGIVAIGTFLLLQGVPILWRVAWALYLAVGLVDMGAVLTGRDERWGVHLRRAQLAAFAIAAFLFLLGTATFTE